MLLLPYILEGHLLWNQVVQCIPRHLPPPHPLPHTTGSGPERRIATVAGYRLVDWIGRHTVLRENSVEKPAVALDWVLETACGL